MTLGKLITQLFRPCSSAPKSPDPPQQDADGNVITAPPRLKENSQGICEVTPCMDISNKMQGTPSPLQRSDKGHLTVPCDDTAQIENSSNQGCVVKVPGKSPGKSATAQVAEREAWEKIVLEVFGTDVLHQLQGKAWDERGQAVQSVRARIVQDDLNGNPVERFFQAGCSVAVLALKDKVMPVFFDGLDLAKLLLGDFATRHSIAKEALQEHADSIVPIIVAKTSDRNARSIEGTQQAIVFLARQQNVGTQQVVAHILTPIANEKDTAAKRGRLELIGHMVNEFGLGKGSSLSLSTLMGFVRPHLEAADEKVRRAAVEVTVGCYTLKGERTMKYCANLKPALLKLLEQRFAEVDKKKGKGSKQSAPVSLPEVRGLKRKQMRNGGSGASSRQSTATNSSVGSRGLDKQPLAPLEMTPGNRQSSREALLDDKLAMPHTDIFAPVYNDVLRSPMSSANPPTMGSPDLQYSMAMGPGGSASLATHEDPNYIPSPTGSKDPFDEEALMNEIEGF